MPVSQLNHLRRAVIGDIEAELQRQRERTIVAIQATACKPEAQARDAASPLTPGPFPPEGRGGKMAFQWSIKVDRICFLDAFADEDWRGLDEVIVDIARDHPALLRDKLMLLADRLGAEKIRLALPALTRAWEEPGSDECAAEVNQCVHDLDW